MGSAIDLVSLKEHFYFLILYISLGVITSTPMLSISIYVLIIF